MRQIALASCMILAAGPSTAVAQQAQEPQARSESDGESLYPSICYAGRFVAYYSEATNLVPGAVERPGNVFLHDREDGTTVLVSKAASGTAGNGQSTWPSISGNGMHVAFTSGASDLVDTATSAYNDVFVYDVEADSIELISVGIDGSAADGLSYTYFPSISYDGRFVLFMSQATNLVDRSTSGEWNVFVRDRQSGTTMLISQNVDGTEGNGPSLHGVISGDGRYVAYSSRADNLVSGDRNGREDVFLHDRETGRTMRISVPLHGGQSDGDSDRAAVSFDGTRVAFSSTATNLVRGRRMEGENVFIYDARTRSVGVASVSSLGAPMQPVASRLFRTFGHAMAAP